MFFQSQPAPIIVDVVKQPAATPDASVNSVLTIFALAGAVVLVAALCSLLVAGGIVLFKRWREASAPDSANTTHTRLEI